MRSRAFTFVDSQKNYSLANGQCVKLIKFETYEQCSLIIWKGAIKIYQWSNHRTKEKVKHYVVFTDVFAIYENVLPSSKAINRGKPVAQKAQCSFYDLERESRR